LYPFSLSEKYFVPGYKSHKGKPDHDSSKNNHYNIPGIVLRGDLLHEDTG